jgi:hypothetical protein
LGDYTEDGDIPNYPNAAKLYQASADWKDISDAVALALGKVFGFEIDTAEGGWRTRKELTTN